MNWLTSLWDQLPLLLVLSPAIGFLVTCIAQRIERGWVRQLGLSNSFCTLLLFGFGAGQFEMDLAADTTARHVSVEQDATPAEFAATSASINRRVDKQRAARLAHKLFVIDGINLWPSLVLIVMVGLVFWRTKTSVDGPIWFIPNALLFESASLAALTTYDLRIYLIAFAMGMLAMAMMLGQSGRSDRRVVTSRFLLSQFCGSSFITLGFAMLIVAVPWMKVEDSPDPLNVSWNIAAIVFEFRKWTTNNSLAFQYQNEVFPWMLSVLSIGFVIQFGLFPFHSSLISVLADSPVSIAVLYITGLLSASCIAWLRFVVPLAPEMLVRFEWLILIPSLGGATWASLRALALSEPRRQAAYLYLALSGVSLLGCYALTRVGMSGAWLMQQQLNVSICLALFAFDSPNRQHKSDNAETEVRAGRYSIRTLLLMLSLPTLGFFASGLMIFSQLFLQSLMVSAGFLVVIGLVLLTIYSLLNSSVSTAKAATATPQSIKPVRGPLVAVVVLAIMVNLFPNLMLHQCEPEFARVFRPFEAPSK